VSALAGRVFGPGGYDLEVWNELTFGSQFLNVASYSPAPAERAARRAVKQVTHAVIKAVLDETVAYVRDPANGISPSVGITDGFASETPFDGGALAPRGLTALSKHPYVGPVDYPQDYQVRAIRPIDARGRPDTASRRSFSPLFIPSFQALLPEYTLTALSTDSLIRDIAPITTRVSRAPHGRYVGPRGSAPVQKWITEYNLSAAATPVGPDGHTFEPQVTMSVADRAHFHAKALLRSLVAMVSKGISREYFFAAAPGALSLIGETFYKDLETNPTSYPGLQAGGEILTSFHNLLTHFQATTGTPYNGPTHPLKLLAIAQAGNHAQFTGDSTTAHPSLYDREVLAVLPFQTATTKYVIPIYVMTSDLATLYQPTGGTDIHRYDLPNETFRITLTNLPENTTPTITNYDPITNQNTPAKLITHQGTTATIELTATDYPRLLELTYTHG
jgi:hypothetical protein